MEVTNSPSFPASDLVNLLSVRRRDFMVLSKLYLAREQLLTFYRNKGYYFAQCTLMVNRVADAPPAPSLVDVNYRMTEGPVCYFRRFRVRGNRRVSRSLITRYTNIRRGERFSQSRLVTGPAPTLRQPAFRAGLPHGSVSRLGRHRNRAYHGARDRLT